MYTGEVAGLRHFPDDQHRGFFEIHGGLRSKRKPVAFAWPSTACCKIGGNSGLLIISAKRYGANHPIREPLSMDNARLLPKFQVFLAGPGPYNVGETMTETAIDVAMLESWSAAQCPFTIAYSRQTLDDIRLSAVDAFSSLPGGGTEIGGVLLGKYENERLTITQHLPLESEHAFGPSFTLSPKDQTGLEELLDAARRNFSDLQPAGWYHSHTQSSISLSQADLDLHKRFFPEAWQVALVVRPSPGGSTRAGFFFRERDGIMRTESSYQEWVLDEPAIGQLPAGMPPSSPMPMEELRVAGPVITLPAVAEASAPAITPTHETRSLEPEVPPPPPAPEFLELPVRRPRPRIGVVAASAAVLALAAAAYQTRANWLPRHAASAPPVARTQSKQPAPPPAKQAAHKETGASKPAVPSAQKPPATPAPPSAEATLRKQAAELQKKAAELTQQNTDLLKVNAELRNQKDELTKQTAKLRTELAAQTARSRGLQQQFDQLRQQQQRRRLANQTAAPLP
ncbi:MAG: hypothetical protein C5B51_05485 [Terriglobia bacterium]|nr:MAG: hypothetical protein C5B51_05485 [Terriglobia bacterium]